VRGFSKGGGINKKEKKREIRIMKPKVIEVGLMSSDQVEHGPEGKKEAQGGGTTA